jgi:hypothetical protein
MCKVRGETVAILKRKITHRDLKRGKELEAEVFVNRFHGPGLDRKPISDSSRSILSELFAFHQSLYFGRQCIETLPLPEY